MSELGQNAKWLSESGQQAMADRQTINHFLERTGKDLEHFKSEAVRIGGDDLGLLVYLLDLALVEARQRLAVE